MSVKKLIITTLSILSGVSFGLAITFFLLQNGFLNSHYRAFVVQSGSMEPAIKTGSMVFTKTSPDYDVGDIITFSLKKDQAVTHRIHAILYDNSVAQYKTKGDANEEEDTFIVPHEAVIGKVSLSAPYVGYLSAFVRTPRGFVLLVVIPASIIVYEEIKKVLQQIKSWVMSFRKGEVISPKGNKGGKTPSLHVLIPLFGVFLLFAGASVSYFADTESSTSNILSAASDFGTTVNQDKSLVINEVLPDSSCFQGNTEAQWIELYNKFEVEVNLKDFKITDGVSVIDLVNAGNIIIQPQGFALLAHNNAIWNHCFDDNDVTTANLGGQLNFDTGYLQLLDADDNILDTVIWEDLAQDISIERVPPGFDTKFGAEFEPADFVEMNPPDPGQ